MTFSGVAQPESASPRGQHGPAQKKLGDLDSNQDKQNQNLLCYRYTIAQ